MALFAGGDDNLGLTIRIQQLFRQGIDVQGLATVQLQINQSTPGAGVLDGSGSPQAPQTGLNGINTLAFAGPTEALLVDRLRASAGSMSLVACEASGVVGHILFTATRIMGRQLRVAGLGPMAVTPARQHSGIGSELVRRGLDACRREGYEAVVVVGHPEYYPRFGFQRGSRFGLRCEFVVPDEVFMAVELQRGALAGGGELRYAPEFSEV